MLSSQPFLAPVRAPTPHPRSQHALLFKHKSPGFMPIEDETECKGAGGVSA